MSSKPARRALFRSFVKVADIETLGFQLTSSQRLYFLPDTAAVGGIFQAVQSQGFNLICERRTRIQSMHRPAHRIHFQVSLASKLLALSL